MLADRPDATSKQKLVARILAWLDAHGHPDAFPDARAAAALVEELRGTARQAAADVPRERLDLAAKVVAGLDPADAAERLARVRERDQGAVSDMLAAAMAQARATAWTALAGPSIVTDYLRPFVEDLAVQAGKHAVKVPAGVGDDQAAIRAGGPVAAAWSHLTRIADQMDQAWKLHDDVVGMGLVEPLPFSNDLSVLEVRYRQPWEGRDYRGQRQRHRVVRLLEDLQEQRQPTCLTWRQAVQMREQRDGVRTLVTKTMLRAVEPDRAGARR